MSSYLGGSAFAMARQISEGYILMSNATIKRFKPHELKALEVEVDKISREVRGDQPALDDLAAIQKRNRKLGRLKQAMQMLKAKQLARK